MMKPLDHSECDPAECIHRAALDTEPQAQELAEDIARSRQEKEQYLRKHPAEARAEQEFTEDEHYDQKRRRAQAMRDRYGVLSGPEAQGLSATVNEEAPRFLSPSEARAFRVQRLEEELLEARALMATHGELGPLQPLRNMVGDALRLLEHKNAAYGDAWRHQGYMGNLARLQSKVQRLRNLLWRDPDSNGYPIQPLDIAGGEETVTDTLVDLINLAAMMAVNWNEDNRWGSV
jgi:hypothetical protein